jgi:hypothetical protein
MPVADPSLPLVKAINAHLRATVAVTELVSTYKSSGPSIFDQAPADVVKPFVSTGPIQMLPEFGDCIDGAQATIQLDAYAANNTPGVAPTVRARQLGAAIAAALDENVLDLDPPLGMVMMEVDAVQYLREPDGITAHAIVTLTARCEPYGADDEEP